MNGIRGSVDGSAAMDLKAVTVSNTPSAMNRREVSDDDEEMASNPI